MTPASQPQPPQTRITIHQTFAELRARGQIGLMPFVPAGYPDLATTEALLPALQRAGANVIEVGIPFSDPIADGPVIQEAFTAALSRKLKLNEVFTTIGRARQSVSIPLVAMVSYSIVFRYGLARFLSNAKLAGFDGVILPDLPPPEAQGVCDQVRSAGLDTILLVAPTTPPQRRAQIAAMCSGFVYYLSVAGITGERQQLAADLRENVRQLKSLTDRPVCVGFGISRAEHVKQLSELADGAIVGSAVVRRIKEHASKSPELIGQAVAEYCRELLSLVR
ncbi:tryptophan synthase subunit alpha [Fontivita pretiosa]|uniref:tryptophan synthase subunit alpha n=1 Tax=Fontivita pretiosa TaxID=2989684 RepID=UPI003D186E6C